MIGFRKKSNTGTRQGFVDLPICRSWVKIIILITLLIQTCFFSARADNGLMAICEEFTNGLIKLDFGRFEYSHYENLKKIPGRSALLQRRSFLQEIRKKAEKIELESLNESQRVELGKLLYELDFQTQLNQLQQKTGSKAAQPYKASKAGLNDASHGREWYSLYINRNASLHFEPEAIMKLGLSEVKRINNKISRLAEKLGYNYLEGDEFSRHLNNPAFNVKSVEELERIFSDTQRLITKNISNIYPGAEVKEVKLMPAPDANKNTPPGFYYDGVFYYNYFENRFNKRAVQWIFLHEVFPGHHFQISLDKDRKNKLLDPDIFWYPGFSEGWAVYCENLGHDLECYKDPYSLLGWMEWDLVRSGRLVIDAGMHDSGWTRQEAIDWWKMNLPLQSDIAEREVDRVLDWPAQAISYKIGELTILELKKRMQSAKKDEFCIKDFHSLLLKNGSVPLSVLTNEVFRDYLKN